MSIINHLDYNASRYEDCNWEDYCGSMTIKYNCYKGE